MTEQSKICERCGRSFSNRKKWKNNFSEVKYCSDKCKNIKIKCWKLELLELLKNSKGNSFFLSDFLYNQKTSDKEAIKTSLRFLAHEKVVKIIKERKQIEPDEISGDVEVRINLTY
jgi:hypothetical protein